MYRVHGDTVSGSGHKVRLLVRYPGEACERMPVDLLRAGTRPKRFATMNPESKPAVPERSPGE